MDPLGPVGIGIGVVGPPLGPAGTGIGVGGPPLGPAVDWYWGWWSSFRSCWDWYRGWWSSFRSYWDWYRGWWSSFRSCWNWYRGWWSSFRSCWNWCLCWRCCTYVSFGAWLSRSRAFGISRCTWPTSGIIFTICNENKIHFKWFLCCTYAQHCQFNNRKEKCNNFYMFLFIIND